MPTLHYTPGPWCAVVVPQGVAVLPAGTDAGLLDEVWTALQAGEGLGAVLEALTRRFGTSLSSLPPFAVATVSGNSVSGSAASGCSVRLAVRGELTIDVVEGSAAETAVSLTVSGADVTTWSERVVAEGRHLTVRTPDGAGGQRFGIASGIVLVSSVEIDVAGGGVVEPAPTAQESAPVPTAAAPTPTPTTAPAPASEAAPGSEAAPAIVAAAAPAIVGAAPAIVSAEATEETLMTGDGMIEEVSPEAADHEPAAEVVVGDEVISDEGAAEQGAADEAAAQQGAADEAAAQQGAADEAAAQQGAADEAAAQQGAADEVDELEHTRDELPDDAYDHLWGATVVKSVEDAAVREQDEDDEAEEVAASSVPVEPAAPSSIAAEPPAPIAPPPPVQSSGLIDSVPDFGGLGAASGSASITGSTVPPGAGAPAAPATRPDDDHDGLTVTVSELEAMRRLGAAGGDAPAALPDSALGRIVLSTGETHPLDKPVIIGRRPRANRVQVDRVPVLVTVPSPEQDISRNHLEIRLEGRHVLVVDLDTTNGSVLHREGTPPLRLGPHEPVLVLSRDIVDIGDGVTVTFEEIP
jgi:hypothetical protein